MNLLHGLTNDEVRAVGVEALRRWRARPLPPDFQSRERVDQLTNDVLSLHGDLGVELIKILAERKNQASPDTHKLKEVFVDDAAMHTAWMCGVLEFIWWMVRAGFAVELQYGKRDDRNERIFPTTLRLTTRGERMLSSQEDDPRLPGYLDRLRARCPGLPNGVLALLADSRACLDHLLMRPAVVLMGVAYEFVIGEVVAALATKGLVQANTPTQEAGERIKRVRGLLRDDKIKLVLPERDDRRRAESAYDFADVLRMRRNEAAHTRPEFDFDDRAETEEFLVSAARHLPGLWSLGG